MKPHLPGHHDEVHAEPGKPHAFVQINDPGLGAMSAGAGGRGGWGISSIAVTDNYIRKSHCGLAGCGKDRDDPIHAAPED